MAERDGGDMRARLREWRRAHPGATFDAIEDAVQEELVRWQAEVVAELAGAGDGGDGAAEAARLGCAGCGGRMQRGGTRAREVLSRYGRSIRLERAYYVCPACGAGVFPPG